MGALFALIRHPLFFLFTGSLILLIYYYNRLSGIFENVRMHQERLIDNYQNRRGLAARMNEILHEAPHQSRLIPLVRFTDSLDSLPVWRELSTEMGLLDNYIEEIHAQFREDRKEYSIDWDALVKQYRHTELEARQIKSTYNEAVEAYHKSINRFPLAILATLLNFQKMPLA